MTKRQKGILYAIIGPVLWGVSGNVAQYLFTVPGITPLWLVAVRLLGAGILMMLWCVFKQRPQLRAISRDRRALGKTAVFGVFGIDVSQVTYFSAVATTNAPTTTVLQYLGPLFIVIYLALRFWRWPRRIDVLSLVIAFVGIVLLVTHGHITALALSPAGLFWGIGAGLGAALYTLLPVRLLSQFAAQAVLAWAMLIAGVVLMPVVILLPGPHLTWSIAFGIAYVMVGGTLLAYLFYLQSLKYLRPTTVGMLNVFEPLTATVIGILCFHDHFGWAEMLGGLLVLSTAFLQTLPTHRQHAQVVAKTKKHHLAG